jgi:hypothetical protein
MDLNQKGDSIKLYIDKSGIGDGADVLDSLTVLKGIYKLEGGRLKIHGVQLGDTLEFKYKKRDIEAKKWFW